jgi:putative transcriptional regulator
VNIVAIRSNLRVLHSQKEMTEARRITYDEIKEKTGVSKSTLSALMNDNVELFYSKTIDRLCEYYNCEPGDLIIRVPSENQSVAA